MDKDDIYFAVATAFALLAFFRVDWQLLRGWIPMPRLTKRDAWFLVLILASLGMSSVGWYKSVNRNPLKWEMKESDEEEIMNRTFINETVELDGKRFNHCHFVNVTFRYHATAPVTFTEGNRFDGIPALLLDNDAAKGAVVMKTFLDDIAADQGHTGQVRLFERNKEGQISPIGSGVQKKNP